MYYAKLLVFYIASFVMLMKIYSFSTYHKFFKRAFPVLIIYGFLVGFLLDFFNFSGIFITILVIYAIHLTKNYRTQKKAINLATLEDDRETQLELQLSVERTMHFHLLSSVVFLVSFSVGFIYIFNTHF